jgi:hypothetical protein
MEVFFVTGRREDGFPINEKTPRRWTRDNLTAAGYADVADNRFARGFGPRARRLQVRRAGGHRNEIPRQDHRQHRRPAERSLQRTRRAAV